MKSSSAVPPTRIRSPLIETDPPNRPHTAGTDAVKFQLAEPQAVYSLDAFKADYQKANDGDGSPIEMSSRVQLSRADHKKLEAACRKAGVDYLCTAFDMESLRFLDDAFDMPFFKIASGEILTRDMLEFMAERDRPVLLSTGMASFDEIRAALGILDHKEGKDVTLMHCVSCYPAPHETINLRVIPELAARFGRPVGYSDHSTGPECCLGAVALGARVIEKHVTPDKNLPGPDHKASATIEEFSQLAASIRRMEQALGGNEKIFSETETGVRLMARKSIVAARNIKAGETIARNDITFKRPGTGLSPMQAADVVGATAGRDIEADRIIRAGDVE